MQHQNLSQANAQQKAQLEKDLKTCEKQVKKYENSLKKLKAPFIDASSPLREIIKVVSPRIFLEKMPKYEDIIFKLPQDIQTGIINFSLHPDFSLFLDLNTHELKLENLLILNQFYVEFDSNKISFNQFVDGRYEKWEMKYKAKKVSALTEEMTHIYLGSQKGTIQCNNITAMEFSIILENQDKILSTDIIQSYEIPIKLDNFKINLILKNQIQQNAILKFMEVFANNPLKTEFEQETEKTRKEILKFTKQDVLLDFIKHFTHEDILEVINAIKFIMTRLALFDDAVKNIITPDLIIEIIDQIKPYVKILKKTTHRLIKFYIHHAEKMYAVMVSAAMPFINAYFDKIIYCDTTHLSTLEVKIREQAEHLRVLREKIDKNKQMLQPILNSRRQTINKMLQHGNEGKKGFPNEFYAGWDVKEPSFANIKNSLADISTLATQLVLIRNNAVSKMAILNHEYQKVIYHDGRQIFFTLVQHLLDNTNKNAPAAIIITEFMIVRNYQQIPQIELRSDKILLCHKNASPIFDKKDADIYEAFLPQNEINELVENELLHSSFKNEPVLNWTLNNTTTVIAIEEILENITPSFLKPEKHLDLSSLYLTLTCLLSSANGITINPSHKRMIDDVSQLREKLYFYQKARYLIKEFLNQCNPRLLTPGLDHMKKYLERNPHHDIHFIAYCQQTIIAREASWASLKRSTIQTNLYNAITAIKFTGDEKADKACLDHLENAIKKYQPAEEKVTKAGLYANTKPAIEDAKPESRQSHTKNNTNG